MVWLLSPPLSSLVRLLLFMRVAWSILNCARRTFSSHTKDRHSSTIAETLWNPHLLVYQVSATVASA